MSDTGFFLLPTNKLYKKKKKKYSKAWKLSCRLCRKFLVQSLGTEAEDLFDPNAPLTKTEEDEVLKK